MRRPHFFVLAAAIPLLLYGRTIAFDFVRADDADLIAANQAFLSDLRNAPRAFARSYFETEGDLTGRKTYYRPVTIVSFMLDAARGGAEPRAYHVTNILLHAAATCLLLAFARAIGAAPAAALGAALVFAVHPVNAQAVAWIAGRNDLLAAVFGLVSLLAFAAQPSWAALHAAAFALALFSKETAIVFPLLAALHPVAILRVRLTRAQLLALALDAAVIIAWVFLRARALSGTPGELSASSLWTAAANLPQLLVHAGKMLVPLRLNVSPGVEPITLAIGALAGVVFGWVAWRSIPRSFGAFAACWVLAFLLPTLLVPGLPAYEHRAYLPLIGVLATIASWPRAQISTRQLGALGAVLVLLATLTWRRLDVFRDPFTYWTDGTRDARFGPIAHVNLGQLHEADGRPLDARREYLRALQRDPHTPKAHNNLGVVLMTIGESDLALQHFREESRRHPWNADAWFNLGLWSEMHGDTHAAREFYRRAVIENPAYVPAREKLEVIPPAAREP